MQTKLKAIKGKFQLRGDGDYFWPTFEKAVLAAANYANGIRGHTVYITQVVGEVKLEREKEME